MNRKAPNTFLVAAIKKYRILFAVATVVFNIGALVLVVLVFPDVSNLWVSVFVLISGATASFLSLADLLVGAEDSMRDDGEDPSSSSALT